MEYWDIYTQDGICTGRRVKRGDAMAIGDYPFGHSSVDSW